MMHDLQELKEGKQRQTAVYEHKDELNTRLKEDTTARLKIREIISTCIDILTPTDIHKMALLMFILAKL